MWPFLHMYTNLGIEEIAAEIANVATSNMLEIEVKLIEKVRHMHQAIDLLPLNKLNCDLVVNNAHIHLGVFGFSLYPRTS